MKCLYGTMTITKMIKKDLQYYVEKMKRLKIDRAHGPAPHKPALLLSVIALIEDGLVTENRIELSPELAEIFIRYWSRVTNRKPDISLPFFHLQSDEFWHLHPNTGYETALRVANQIKGISRIREVVAHACLDDELFLLLTDAADRETIRRTLIRTYFQEYIKQIGELIEEQQQIGAYRESLIDEVESPFSTTKPKRQTGAYTKVRDAGFRQAIMRLYDYTCAVCELRIVTMDGESASEAAHIIPFRVSQNDDTRNGVSLCKLHHWAFDRGLFSLSENHRVVVSGLMSEDRPTEWKLTELEDTRIQLPDRVQFRPAQEAMAWHRDNVLRQV